MYCNIENCGIRSKKKKEVEPSLQTFPKIPNLGCHEIPCPIFQWRRDFEAKLRKKCVGCGGEKDEVCDADTCYAAKTPREILG